jgi:hypothetical protein
MLTVAFLIPEQVCRYQGDVGTCGSGLGYELLAGLGAVIFGGGLIVWAIRGGTSPWQPTRRG